MKANALLKIMPAVVLALAVVKATAATYTWQGNGGNWTEAGNWVGGVVPPSNQTVVFDGPTQTTINNNVMVWVAGFIFLPGAGEFTVDGINFSLSGDIINYSTSRQTFLRNITLQGHRIFNARNGDLEIRGDISGGYNVRKEGLETLELRGSNSYTGVTQILAGRLLINNSNISPARLEFGQAVGGYAVGNNATFEVIGGNLNHTGDLNIMNYGANKVVVGTGLTVTFGTYNNNAAWGTINFDVSAPGAVVAFGTAIGSTKLTGTGQRILHATITDGEKTGFVRIDNGDGYKLKRLTDDEMVDLTTNPAGAFEVHARLAGDYTLPGWRPLNSLVLQGTAGGRLDGAANASLQLREILMEEGTGDYTFGNFRTYIQGAAPTALVIHQYSTDGALAFEQSILSDGAAHSFTKTGPGTVILKETSVSSYTGATRVQSGRLQLDGSLTSTSEMIVYDDAILSGGGSYGNGTTSTLIRAGGTLEGSRSKSLAISGAATFEADSNFAFTLDDGNDAITVTGAVVLNDGVKLQLTVAVPELEEGTLVHLLSSDTGITGSFVYNQVVLGNLDLLRAGGYLFVYHQDAKNIWLESIPEPSALGLMLSGVLWLGFRRRLKRR